MKKLMMTAMAALLLTACQESVEEKAAKEARSYTRKNCPAQLDETLRIDSLTYEPSTRTLHYYYTLLGEAAKNSTIDAGVARSSLLHELRNTTMMKAYKDEGFNFAYTYRSELKADTIVFETSFSQQDYQ